MLFTRDKLKAEIQRGDDAKRRADEAEAKADALQAQVDALQGMTGKGGKPITDDDIRASIAQSAFDAGYRLGLQDAQRKQVKVDGSDA